MKRPRPATWLVLAVALALPGACGASGGDRADPQAENPPPTAVPQGPLPGEATAALDALVAVPTTTPPVEPIDVVRRSGDVRAAWLLVDLLRFHHDGPADTDLREALRALTEVEPPAGVPAWVFYGDQLLLWDVPAPPGYFDRKRALYVGFEPGWEAFFDPDSPVDWRAVSWSGVGRDEVQALVDPEVVPAGEGTWLAADDAVAGVQVAGETRAYPVRVLEAHEVVTDGLGGRRITLPYCSLCGAAGGYYADGTPEGVGVVDLRPSGLVFRSNKLFYDAQTESLVEQLRGEAVTGDLADAGVALERFPVTMTTWGAWRTEHPGTTVVSEDGGVGRVYVPGPAMPADDWPRFPVGGRDDRLDVHERVLVGIADDGRALAFPVGAAEDALGAAHTVELGGIEVVGVAGGLGLRDALTGRTLPSLEAYWFAWSQFYPDALLWDPES